jgi:mannose/cellobiose epimerase-like protein (N-acyl-D-glucosamine 2-epimerase family)
MKEMTHSIKGWLFDEALPFWASTGLDRERGGPVESFNLDGVTPSGADFKRARVSCRQVYVFSHAEQLGWPGAKAAADHVFEFLVDRFWLGNDLGLARRVTLAGELLDATPDLYDFAFFLFALGWRFKARGDSRCLSLAHETLDFIDRRFRHQGGEGFHAVLPSVLPREQNPHMHMTEAALILSEASGDARFLSLANEMVALFKSKICQMPAAVLPEFFGNDWTPLPATSNNWVEPGHQFEWAWILSRYQQLTGRDVTSVVEALVNWAESHGVSASNKLTFNRVGFDGSPIDRGSRSWPNTERIKGWIGLSELTGVDAWPRIEESTEALFSWHLGQAPKGCWVDQFDSEGRPASEIIPTSTLYHVFLAFAEVLRFQETSK